MIAVNYSNVRENFKTYCDKVNDDAETIIVTRKNNKNVVLMSQDEYNNILENIKILKNPKYFIKLYESIKELEKGNVHELEEKDLET
ncbi:type II toxin-antitoxin system Phd/YefM family antitoxin [Clostridium sp. WILCCON 0269]|uniref:Antitoxin n=1 Tax=Candidatus Clostridium eludens TaxID=3381663 RepID=A0ABW8SMR9_9CLOT